jgi:hypothetical protein
LKPAHDEIDIVLSSERRDALNHQSIGDELRLDRVARLVAFDALDVDRASDVVRGLQGNEADVKANAASLEVGQAVVVAEAK